MGERSGGDWETAGEEELWWIWSKSTAMHVYMYEILKQEQNHKYPS